MLVLSTRHRNVSCFLKLEVSTLTVIGNDVGLLKLISKNAHETWYLNAGPCQLSFRHSAQCRPPGHATCSMLHAVPTKQQRKNGIEPWPCGKFNWPNRALMLRHRSRLVDVFLSLNNTLVHLHETSKIFKFLWRILTEN